MTCALLLAALALADAAVALGSPVQATGGWCRPGGRDAACFVTLQAPGGDRLVSVESPAAAEVVIQEIDPAGGVRRLAEGVALPAGQTVRMGPHGKHLVLSGLKRPLSVGAKTTLTLRFARAAPQMIAVFALPALPQQPQGRAAD